MKKLLLLLSFVLISAAFTSCEINCDDDDDSTYDRLIGRTWVGDFGMFTSDGTLTESGITFDPNGFGEDEVFYFDGRPAGKFAIRWNLDRSTLRVDYGNAAPARELRNVRIRNGILSGELYIFDDMPNPYYKYVTLYLD